MQREEKWKRREASFHFHIKPRQKRSWLFLSGSKWFNMGNSITAWPSNREAIDVENPTKGWIILKNSIAKTTTKVWSIRWASTSNVETTLFLKVKLAILISQTYCIQSFLDSVK